MKPLQTLAIPLLLAIGCGSASANHTPAATDADVQALGQALEDAWNAHDPDAHTALFTADGTVVTPTELRVAGRDELRKLFASPGPTKQTSTEIEIEAVQTLGPDLILVDAVQTLSGPGTEMIGTRGRLAAVARRVDGSWRLMAARPSIPVGR